MKHISILVPESTVLDSITAPRYLFTAVNNFLATAGQPPRFDVQLVGLTREVRLHDGLFTVHPNRLVSETTQTDLIIIPALFGDIQSAIELNQDFVPWIQAQHKGGAEVCSLCVGAFLLASTGLLDGKKCSTHWLFAHDFRQMFPEITLVTDKIVTEEHRIYTSGGANSYWNLLLHLVEKNTDRAMAILVAKFFAVEIDRESQSAFMMFNGQKNHEDEPIKQAQTFIEAHVTEKISVDDLAFKFAIGRRNFERRFKKATNNTPVEYIQRVKIEAAKKSLETGRKNVNEVMFDVGYSDVKTFRSVFKKVTGLSPMEYRNKYNLTAMTVPKRGIATSAGQA
ncbi:MAG: helix-turn-helix domain-containing protein [Saprospiraceae bacterium]|nr:helix-turn-helix domain-containing protein [Saprospiraceae bacterium]